jgi:hypothetical protein
MTTTALTTTDRTLTTTDVMTAFGAFLRLYVADGDASFETIRSYYGNTAQFVVWCGEHGINPVTVTEDDSYLLPGVGGSLRGWDGGHQAGGDPTTVRGGSVARAQARQSGCWTESTKGQNGTI